MGRLSASGARLHELRQPKPNNAAFRQSRPPRSHGSSLGPEHPQRAIPPACREGPTLGVDVIGPPPVPPAQRKQEPPRRVRTRRGGQGERSPPPPLGTPPAACPRKAPRGCCPGRAAARRTRGIPTEFRATPALRRQFGGDAARAGLRESGAPRRVPGISAGKPSKEALHRGRSGEPRQRPRSVARPNGGFAEGAGLARRQIAASMPHAGGPTDRRPRPRLSKRPRKRPWGGQLRRRKRTERNAAPDAPQERRPAI